MRNPLNKRLPRELKAEFGKYLVLFLFLAGIIGLISGFLVASSSMIKAYDESFEKYHIEDGNFELESEASESAIQSIEKEGVTIYPNYYVEEETGNVDSVLRIFADRTQVDLVCLMQGEMPKEKDEIAIDRMYADNNDLSVGGTLEIGGRDYQITGLVALSDYSALFSSTADMMFDAVKFGVAIVSEDGFAALDDTHLHYSYAWVYENPPTDDKEAKQMAEDLTEVIGKKGTLVNVIPEFTNQAIRFTGDDMGGDKAMMTAFLYIVVIIIAFVFAVTTSNTITKEATVIGTLRASGYSRKELIRHYMTMPCIVMLVAAAVGNILGYTIFEDYMAGMYYGSYSLPTYETVWSAEAFWKTTLIPLLLLIVINYVMLRSKFTLSPLRFMRRDLTRRKRKRAMHLSYRIPFLRRFRMRIIFQNLPNYLTLFAGIFFAVFILLFGCMFGPLLDHYEAEIKGSMISKYQYILQDVDMEDMPKDSVMGSVMRLYLNSMRETAVEGAEKFSVTTLKTQEGKRKSEEVSVYGISPDSDYVHVDLTDPDAVYLSTAFAEKHQIHVGDSVVLEEPYEDQSYTFQVTGIYDYPTSLAVFMSRDAYAETFGLEEDAFNGYFSDQEITDIDESYIAATITMDDLNKTCRQLRVSMGGYMILLKGFGVIMFALVIYLLSKVVIEKNASSISMAKILGYTGNEIVRLYVAATSIVVVLSVFIVVPLSNEILGTLCRVIFAEYSGWLPYYMPFSVLAGITAVTILTYGIVAALQMQKVKKIPMTDALKNTE